MMPAHVETISLCAPDGVRLIADVAGPKDAPAVILLHGGGQTRHSWHSAVTEFADAGYHVINFDARGHGDSDWSENGAYSLDDRAADLAAVAALASNDFVLVGASLGGATAMHAASNGLAARALILVDIVPEPEESGIERIMAFMRGNPAGFSSLQEAADAVAAYNPHRARPVHAAGLRRNLREKDDGRYYWHWDPRIMHLTPSEHHRLVRQAAQTLASRDTPPVLLVRGLSSDVVSDRSIARFADIVPRLEVLDVAGAGHMVAGDRNTQFNAGVFAYLQRYLPLDPRR